ncbi:MAG TPA: hypothetical protein VN281_22530 [Verrucomicrobiae bacterium]|nr:hypothetical protein [Verrucomicrobiae bacterium]
MASNPVPRPDLSCDQIMNAAIGIRITGISFIDSAAPNNAPAMVILLHAIGAEPLAITAKAANTGARAGISSMHDPPSARNPGEAIKSTVVKTACGKPLNREQITNIDDNKTDAKQIVIKRGPRMDREMSLKVWVIRKVCNGG